VQLLTGKITEMVRPEIGLHKKSKLMDIQKQAVNEYLTKGFTYRGSLGNKTPNYIWQRYEQQQVNKDPRPRTVRKLYPQTANGNPFKLKRAV